MSAFEFPRNMAEQYVPYGCGEYIIDNQSFGTPSGVINLLKALEITLHNGYDPVSKQKMGLPLGRFSEFKSFDELLGAYKRQVEFYIEIMAEHELLEYQIAGEHSPFLLMSLLYGNCLKRGKGILNGGIDYLGGTLETYGNTNTADSLLAIKKMVYENKRISQSEFLRALDLNFEGYEVLRKEILELPKYGNDSEEADNMLKDIHNHVCSYTRKQSEKTGLHSYLVVVINNSANTLMGKSTSASADGRRYGEHMNNGNTPTGGNDKNGITAMMNSIVKPRTDIHAGAVQNMKFSKGLIKNHKQQFKNLISTYFQQGGAQAMITVLSRGDLENAIKYPEKYENLMVRVGGFSARFVKLTPDIQLDIISRTLY
jgi:pyruvate-formate lyase